MLNSLENRVIALAGLHQACAMVQQTARQGKIISPPVQTCIHSLFKVNAESVIDVYGSLYDLKTGLDTLIEQFEFDKPSAHDMEITRYMLALVYLERKASRKPALMDRLASGIRAAAKQADYFSEVHNNVLANLAELYQQTISTLSPTILVTGEQDVLSNPENADLVRALLLAGIRSAMLWQQCGGRRWHFLFARKKILREALRLRQSLSVH